MTGNVRRHPRLATRLTIATVGLLVPLYVILLVGYARDVREQRTAELNNAVFIGEMTASVVKVFRQDLEGTMLAAGLALGEQTRPLDQETVGPYLDALSHGYPMLRALFLTDPQGRVIASQASTGVGTDVSTRPYIVALQGGADAVWSGGLAGLQTGQTTIAYARVVRGADGAARGFLVSAFQPQAIVERVPISLARDASFVLIDERGRVLYAADSTDLVNLADLSDDPLVRRALDGTTVRLDGNTTPLARGTQYGALVPVTGSGWIVAYTRPLESLESSLQQRLLVQALAISVVMLVAAAIIAYLTHHLLRPLRTLVAAAAAVARGERTHVGISAGDGDVLALAGAMDVMSAAVVEREEALRDETRLVEALRRIGETLAAELDLEKLAQATTDAATRVTGAELGAFFYTLEDEHSESVTRYTVSGASDEVLAGFAAPSGGATLSRAWPGFDVVRLDDVTLARRDNVDPPFGCAPASQLPIRSYLAVPVLSRSGDGLGTLFFGHSRAGVFTERAERLACGIAGQAAIAIDNARLFRQAQEAIRLRDEFLSIASHELRTPITTIKITAQSAQRAHERGMLDAARVQRALVTIEHATERVARLASDLLDVARLRVGQMPMDRESIELRTVVERIVASFREQWDGKHALVCEFGDDEPMVDADVSRLEQVLANLLENAAKYSPEGSVVRVATTRDAAGVRVSVIDQGIGLPAESIAALFQPFGRASNAVAQHIQGLGLGLYISRQILEALGGRIWADSRGDGQGSSFHVWLPVAALGEPGVN